MPLTLEQNIVLMLQVASVVLFEKDDNIQSGEVFKCGDGFLEDGKDEIDKGFVQGVRFWLFTH
ncbi:unnamed protein product [marine sediment metagenome]|uniref:Uncharacterized protein n=1 Tax=marine sediment metagenome TaxID=412755 RepID=X0UWD5_9ZZZZ